VAFRRADREPPGIRIAAAKLLDQRAELGPLPGAGASRHPPLDAGEHLVEPLAVHRLHQVIHRAHLECLERELVMSGDEDDRR
jgi:hypothetical protein